METTGEVELSVTLGSSVQCEERKEFSECDGRPMVKTVDNGEQQLVELSTQRRVSATILSFPVAGSANEERRQGRPRDPLLRNCNRLGEQVLQVTAHNGSELHSQEQHSVSSPHCEIGKGSQRRVVVSDCNTEPCRVERNRRSDVHGGLYAKSMNGHGDLTLRSQFDVAKGTRVACLEVASKRCISEQKQLAETRMQLWLERNDHVGFDSSPAGHKPRRRHVKPSKKTGSGCSQAGDSDKGTYGLKLSNYHFDDKEMSEISQKSREKYQQSSSQLPAAAIATSNLEDVTSNYIGAKRTQSLPIVSGSDKQHPERNDCCVSLDKDGKRRNRWNDKHKIKREQSSRYCSSSPLSCSSENGGGMKTVDVVDGGCVTHQDNNKNGFDNYTGDQLVREKSSVLSNISGESNRRSPLAGQGDWSTRALGPESLVSTQSARWGSISYGSRRSAISPMFRDASTQTEFVRCEHKEIATQTEYGGDVEIPCMLSTTRSLQFSSYIPLSVTVKDVADMKSSTCSQLTTVVEKFEHTVLSGSRTSTPQLEEQIEEYLSSARKEAESSDRKDRHVDSTVEDISPAVSPTRGSTTNSARMFSFPASANPSESFHQGSLLADRNMGTGQSTVGRRKRRKRWDVTTSEVEMYDDTNSVSRERFASLWHGHVETKNQEVMGSTREKLEKSRSDQTDSGMPSLAFRPSDQLPVSATHPTPCRSTYPPCQHTDEGDSTPPLEDYDDYDEADEPNRDMEVSQPVHRLGQVPCSSSYHLNG